MSDLTRQLDILKPSDITAPVTIIGAGGLGSWCAFALAKCGYPRLTVWDDDRIEAHNCPNQLYRLDQIGRLKVEALAEIIAAFTGTTIATRPRRIMATDSLRGVIIVTVDSMAARTYVWNMVRDNVAVPLLIDARMARESGRVYTINPCHPDQAEFYAGTLYSDAEADEAPCTARAIIHNTWAINALIGSQLKQFWKGGQLAVEILFELNTQQWIYRNPKGQVLARTGGN